MQILLNAVKNSRTKMDDFLRQCKMLLNDKKALISIGIILSSLIFIIFCALSHKRTAEAYTLQYKRNDVILHKLNDINATVHTLESNPATTIQQKAALQSLQDDVISIKNSINDTAKTIDIQKISEQLASVKNDLDANITDLKKSVSQGMGNKEYVDASALPFHVVSIDIIAGQPYVSVDYGTHILPLTIGDLLTDWRVAYVDYDTGIAEFINEKGQHVKVDIQGT